MSYVPVVYLTPAAIYAAEKPTAKAAQSSRRGSRSLATPTSCSQCPVHDIECQTLSEAPIEINLLTHLNRM